MSTHFELTAEHRPDQGKGASRRLRHQDKVPAIMYGAGQEAVQLAFDHKKLAKALENEAFYSHILTIHIDGKKEQAVLKDLQRHPFKPRILHMDLLRISGKEKITMHVPLHFIGETIAPGVKKDGGLVTHQLTSVEIRCLPSDLPEFIEADLSTLALNDAFHLSDLKLPKGVELVGFGPEHDLPVASIHLPRVAVEAEETGAPVAPAAPEAIRQIGDKETE